MTRVEFIQAVEVELNENKASRALVGRVLAAASAVMLAVLTDESQSKVDLFGLGTLKVVQRAARTGRNPRTGAAVEIPAKRAAKFTPGKAVKEALKG